MNGIYRPSQGGMRWANYERWVAKYDAAEEMLDAQLVMAAARLMKWISPRSPDRLPKAPYFMPACLGEYV